MQQQQAASKKTFVLNPKEESIVTRCLANDRTAQKELFYRYKDGMFTVAMRITQHYEDACDALQEAFIQVFRDLPKFQKRATLGAWIKTIVVRCALKKVKQRKSIRSFDTALHDTPVIWNDELTGQYLDKAIQQLPKGYRTVFVLIEIEGYTHKEVAEMLGISSGTSKSQLFYAKKNLRKILSDIGLR